MIKGEADDCRKTNETKKRRKKLSYALILVNLRGKTKVCAGKNICCILN